MMMKLCSLNHFSVVRCVNRLRCSFRCFLRFYAKGSHIIDLYVWGGYYTVERKNYRRKELAASYTFPIF